LKTDPSSLVLGLSLFPEAWGEDRSKLLSLRIKPIPRSLGRKYGRSYPKLAEALVAEALGNLGENEVAKLARGEPVMVQVDGEAFKVEPEDVEVVEEALEGYSVAEAGEFLVGVCVVIDEDLRDEGLEENPGTAEGGGLRDRQQDSGLL